MLRNITKDLIRPKKLDFDEEGARYGKFVAEPLERGYGTTIGNSMRRVMLSSLPGAAITSVKINGVNHEFTTLPGCVEDVTEIILNLKQVVVKLIDKDSASLKLEVKGPCEVKAGMIEGDPNALVVNPELHIASLNEEGALSIELGVRMGRGYVVAEENKDEMNPVGTIPVDSLFSPVRKVNYVVTNARVGQRTDYDKLSLEVWTDGSISPNDAVEGAAYILKDQFGVFAGDQEVIEVQETVEEEEKPKLNENLFRRIDELELSVRSANCLENSNIKYIGELVLRTEAEMLRTKNFGRKSLNEIKEILSEMNLSLGMRLENFPSREELDRLAEEQSGSLTDI